METNDVISSQYRAALDMLAQAVVRCPDPMWDNPAHKNRFWRLAYHAVFYTHLYLHRSEADFVPWEKHREHVQFMGTLPWPPHDPAPAGEPYSKDEILAYLDLVRAEVPAFLAGVDLDAPSGFDWVPLNKLELQLYNIRHTQHHTGELCERLGEGANIDVDWIGLRHE
jgi:hypothetical protein